MKTAAYGIVILALVIGIVPQLTQCNPAAGMRCHWTAQASLALAIPLGLVGIIAAVSKNKVIQRALAVPEAALGIMAILLPTLLIGVCMSPTMRCNMIMKPTLIFVGLIAVALSASMYVLSRGEPR